MMGDIALGANGHGIGDLGAYFAIFSHQCEFKHRVCPTILLQLPCNIFGLLCIKIKMQGEIRAADTDKVDSQALGGYPITGELVDAGHGRDGVGEAGLMAAEHISHGVGGNPVQRQQDANMIPIIIELQHFDTHQKKRRKKLNFPFIGYELQVT